MRSSPRGSTRLHLGTISFDPREPELRAGILAVLGLAVTVFIVLAVAVYAIGHAMGSAMALSVLLTISLASGLSIAVVATALAIVATYVPYRHCYDPERDDPDRHQRV